MKLEEIMFLPIYDNDMLEIMEKLGMKIPKLDKKYEIEEVVGTDSKDGSIGFEFREIDGYSKDGEPCLIHISIENNYKEDLPYGISFKDSYEECCKKIGRKNDYNSIKVETNKLWLIDRNNGLKILLTIRFTESFDSIKYILFNRFDINKVGFTITENN